MPLAVVVAAQAQPTRALGQDHAVDARGIDGQQIWIAPVGGLELPPEPIDVAAVEADPFARAPLGLGLRRRPVGRQLSGRPSLAGTGGVPRSSRRAPVPAPPASPVSSIDRWPPVGPPPSVDGSATENPLARSATSRRSASPSAARVANSPARRATAPTAFAASAAAHPPTGRPAWSLRRWSPPRRAGDRGRRPRPGPPARAARWPTTKMRASPSRRTKTPGRWRRPRRRRARSAGRAAMVRCTAGGSSPARRRRRGGDAVDLQAIEHVEQNRPPLRWPRVRRPGRPARHRCPRRMSRAPASSCPSEPAIDLMLVMSPRFNPARQLVARGPRAGRVVSRRRSKIRM